MALTLGNTAYFDMVSDAVLVLDMAGQRLAYVNHAALEAVAPYLSLPLEPGMPLQSLLPACLHDLQQHTGNGLQALGREARSIRLLLGDTSKPVCFDAKLQYLEGSDQHWLVLIPAAALDLVGTSLTRLNQLYTVLSETNKITSASQTRTDLFEATCRIAVELGGFKMAWIGICHGEQVIPVSWYGDDQGYLKALKVRTDDSELARGPVGRAVITGEVHCVNDISTDESFSPWREAAMQRGFYSMAALPIDVRGRTIGVFALYSSVKYYFDIPVIDLLEDMSNDISLGLRHIDQETSRIEMESKYRQLFQAIEHSSTAVTITDDAGVIEYVNPHFCQLSGYQPEELLGLTFSEFGFYCLDDESFLAMQNAIESGNEWQGEMQNRTKGGQVIWTLQHVTPIKSEDGEITHIVSTGSDITKLHDAQETIEQLAYYDELTGLPNRRLFYDRLEHSFHVANRDQSKMAVCFLDLDGFKMINDSLGHEAGDELLKEVANRLRISVRSKDTVSRLGGDEFTVILSDISKPEDVAVVSRNIIETLAKPISLGENRVVVTTSIGAAIYPDDGQTIEDLTRHADMAMYHAKGAGRNNYQFFTAEMNQKVQSRMELEWKLRTAIENAEFRLFYQPIIDAVDGSVTSVEAILKWQDPEKGLIDADSFMPLAEETGLVVELGDWVLKQLYQDCQYFHQQAVTRIPVSVDINAHQFRNPGQFLETLQSMSGDTLKLSDYLQFEVNESILSEDVKASVETLSKIRTRGYRLAVDKFGMGYSSLRYLKRFPVDVIKIDRSFVRDVAEDSNDAAITSAIIALAHSLDFKVLAEGVDTVKHLQFLERYWCDYLQGRHFCEPLPLQQCVEYINRSFEQLG